MRLDRRLTQALTAAVAVCLSTQTATAVDAPLNPSVTAATTSFGLKMLHQLAATKGDKNIFVSPASIAVCLDMAYNGARAGTQTAMSKTLNLNKVSVDELNRSNEVLLKVLNSSDPKVDITVANSIWAKKSIPFKSEFINLCRETYQAQATTLDFAQPQSLSTINEWVKKKTNGMIPTVLDKIDPLATMFLVNVVYFNGKWSVPFDPTKTRPETFHLLTGKTKKVPQMHGAGGAESGLAYLETPEFQMVRLEYGDGRFGMYVLLPQPGVNYKTFLAGLTTTNWTAWCKRMGKGFGTVALPKFTVEFKSSLKETLSQLGMGVAFDKKQANFKGISDHADNFYLFDVYHLAKIKVDEQGTEAAAASVGTGAGGGEPPKIFHMNVDRPFIIALTDSKTDELLFIGSIVDPH